MLHAGPFIQDRCWKITKADIKLKQCICYSKAFAIVHNEVNKIIIKRLTDKENIFQKIAKKPLVTLSKVQRSTAQAVKLAHRKKYKLFTAKCSFYERASRRRLLKESHEKECGMRNLWQAQNTWFRRWSGHMRSKYKLLAPHEKFCLEKNDTFHKPQNTTTKVKHSGSSWELEVVV